MLELAQAVGVPVDQRVGGQLATTLVATMNDIILARVCGIPAFFVWAVDYWQ